MKAMLESAVGALAYLSLELPADESHPSMHNLFYLAPAFFSILVSFTLYTMRGSKKFQIHSGALFGSSFF